MSDPRFIRAFSSDIEKESEKRRKLLLEKAADVKMYLNGITDYSDTIRALEETF